MKNKYENDMKLLREETERKLRQQDEKFDQVIALIRENLMLSKVKREILNNI